MHLKVTTKIQNVVAGGALTLLLILSASSSLLADDETVVFRKWVDAAFLGNVAGFSTNDTEFSMGVPFSFVYDGKSSTDFLQSWKREVKSEAPSKGKERHVITYTDPKTGLEVRCEATCFTGRPAIDWVMYFKNNGKTDTPILERIRPMDLGVKVPEGPVILHRLTGAGHKDGFDFLPISEVIQAKTHINFVPESGRSSSGNAPFFNLEWNGGGLVGAIGWTGAWTFSLERNEGYQVALQSGQMTTHLKLLPGEQIRTPRILLISWKGNDRFLGHNRLRHLLLDHYVPRINGEIAIPPVSKLTIGLNLTEKSQKDLMPDLMEAGVENFWIDAGWYEGRTVGNWAWGVDDWVPKKAGYPNGLRPVSDEAHKLGMKFTLWLEPERVWPFCRIAKEHPEWLINGSKDALYNLGNTDARIWMTDFLSKCITDWGIDIFRNDANIAPLYYWPKADVPDRQGIAEIRYIEGLYTMWDELLKRHPALLIDNCASGGRRIDLEMISRSVPLWQSDSACSGPHPVPDQIQNAGLGLYVPLHSSGVWAFDKYNFRSVATLGCCICPDIAKDKKLFESAKKMIAEVKSLRPYYLGDYYPLLEINSSESAWCGWQYDRPDLGKGFAMCFRRAQSPYPKVELSLHGLDTNSTYQVTNMDTGTKQTLTGAEMSKQFAVEILEKPGSVLFVYEKVK